MSKEAEQILVVGPSWVGDMVMAQSLFMLLHQNNPESLIDVVAPQWSLPILERMPQVREGFGLSVGHGEFGWTKRYQLAKQLKSKAYNRAIILPRSLKAALVPFLTGIPLRTGYRGEWRYGLINDVRALNKTVLDQTVKRFVALGPDRGIDVATLQCPQPRLQTNDDNLQRLLSELDLNLNAPVVGLLPGAEYGPAKQWPVEYYGQLTSQLRAQGIQVWILGSQKDKAVADSIVEFANGQGINLCGATRLEDVVDLIAQMKAVVSNDSGLMHVAAAVGCPVIAVYGSSSPSYTPPLTDKAKVLYLNLECSPCFKRQCPLGHLDCLKKIEVTTVYQQVTEYL